MLGRGRRVRAGSAHDGLELRQDLLRRAAGRVDDMRALGHGS